MAVLRRIGAGAVLALAAVGLLLCLAVIVAVWAIRPPVDGTVDTGIATFTGYLNRATGDIQRADAGLMDMQGAADSVAQQARQGTVAPNLITDLTARVQRLSDRIAGVQDRVATLQQGVDAAHRLPGVKAPALQAHLSTASDRLTQVQDRLGDLQDALARQDNARVATAAATVSGAIGTARDALTDAQANIARTHAALTDVQGRFPR
jgi:predicted  nucleic acid-binding Zn-ribbon protein